MLLAILSVLKIIGIIILAVLGIIIFLLLLLLFIPFRYRVIGKYDEENKNGRITLSWLLRFLSAKVMYEDKSVDMTVKVIGIPVYKKNLLNLSKDKNDFDDDDEDDEDDDFLEEFIKKKSNKESNNKTQDNRFDSTDEKTGKQETESSKDADIIHLDVDKDDSQDLNFDNLEDNSIDIDSEGTDLKIEESEEKDILGTVLNAFFAVFNFCLFGIFKIFDLMLALVFGFLFIVIKGINLLVSKEDNLFNSVDRGIDKFERKIADAKDGYDSFAGRVSNISKKIKGFKFKTIDFKRKIRDIKLKIKNIKSSIDRFKRKTKNTRDKFAEYKKLYESKRFKKTFAFLKKEVIKLLKHVLPRKCKGHVKFGFEEPDKTGKVYGYVAMLYGISGKRLKKFDVIPEFERKIFEANVDIKGHIRLIHVLIVTIKVLLNRNIWIIKKKFDKINSKYKDMEMDEGFYSFEDDLDAIS